MGVFLITYLITPLFRRIAKSKDIMDYPGGRKLQRYPVPYLGGLAISIPLSTASLILFFIDDFAEVRAEVFLGIILPSLAIASVGLLDDMYELNTKVRFTSQSIVGSITSIFMFSNGTGVRVFNYSVLNIIFTILWVVLIINALNFIDNMDGLATSISFLASLTFFIISLVTGQFLISAICAALAGSSLGFLFWNKKPAKIYLGDSGALYIGFLLAAISIRIDVNNATQLERLLIPILILGIPFIDSIQVIFFRIYRGKSPFQGGRDHISHLLLERGLGESIVIKTICMTAVIFSCASILIVIY
jgi:UDP-GlcNAc:undecaprenyl-phosphate GlcNAc-1-phosphate transferase